MRVQSQKESNSIQIFARYFILSFLLIALDGIGLFALPKNLTERFVVLGSNILRPAIELVLSPIEYLKSGHNANLKIRNLEQRLAESVVSKAELQTLQTENQDLRNLLEAPLSPSWDYILAPVIGRKGGELQIGLGSADGVVANDVVVYEENFVGTVTQVSEKISTVKTLKNPNTRFRAKVVDAPTDGIVSYLDNQIIFGQILQSADISVGDIVETSGTDQLFPGIVVGVVSGVEADPDGIHQRAKIDPTVDPHQLQNIFIVSR